MFLLHFFAGVEARRRRLAGSTWRTTCLLDIDAPALHSTLICLRLIPQEVLGGSLAPCLGCAGLARSLLPLSVRGAARLMGQGATQRTASFCFRSAGVTNTGRLRCHVVDDTTRSSDPTFRLHCLLLARGCLLLGRLMGLLGILGQAFARFVALTCERCLRQVRDLGGVDQLAGDLAGLQPRPIACLLAIPLRHPTRCLHDLRQLHIAARAPAVSYHLDIRCSPRKREQQMQVLLRPTAGKPTDQHVGIFQGSLHALLQAEPHVAQICAGTLPFEAEAFAEAIS
mmetsp:Transcript_971/g.1854  ORF Transcript_971/g.1854 Transcript_971/m.1854 type:complete len:284 (-) Transcript_971:212-1063(-)